MPPDLAQVDGGVTSDAKTAREASDANNAAMGKVLLALKGAGIEEKDIQTSRLSLQPQYAPNRTGPSPIVGYRASNRVTIRVRDVTKVAERDRHAGRRRRQRDRRHQFHGVAGLESCSTRPASKAVADARRKAEIYAKAAGVTLGAPLEHFRGRRARRRCTAPRWRRGMAAAPTPVAQGEETLSVTVSVTWAIKPRQ